MASIKECTFFTVLFLIYLLHMNYALQCKICEKNDSACLLGQYIETSDCASDNDVCYSWFDRTRSKVGVQRGCMSPDAAEYKTVKKLINNKDNACVKRVNGLDCFKFCSFDMCN